MTGSDPRYRDFNDRTQPYPSDDDLGDLDDIEFEDDFLEDDSPEEWELYLERMTPAPREKNTAKQPATPVHSPSDVTEQDPGFREDEPPQKKKSPVGLIVALVLLLAAAGAGLYVWFCTDLYFVAQVEMEPSSMNLYVGEQSTLSCETTSFGSGEPELEWSSSNAAVAQVDAQGGVTALSQGVTTITVTEPVSGRNAECVLSVYRMDQIIPEFTDITMGEGEIRMLNAVMGTGGSGAPEYTVSDSSVAAVSADGTITAAAPGKTGITITARGFEDAAVNVEVVNAPTVITTDVSGAMCAGETRRLAVTAGAGEGASRYTYTSADQSVVEVDESGLMTAKGKGETTVTVTAYNGVSLQLPITVSAAPSSVEVKKKLTVYSGQPIAIGATDKSESCRQFYYTVSDPSVLAVDENGIVTVLKKGEATVTCTSYNGVSADCRITTELVDCTTPYTSRMVYDNIAALQATYPEIISTESIGSSVQGRDITLLKLGTGQRKVLVVAGMHSREGIAVNFTMRCIDEYAEALAAGKHYGRYNVKKLLSEYTIYFVPLINPDGMDIFAGIEMPEYTEVPYTEEELDEFKNTANGVNLNRNFPFEWGAEGINVTTPDHRSYAGVSAGSEPETQAIIELCKANEFEWLLDMHCKGHLIYYQDKVNEVTEESNRLARRLYTRFGFTLTDQSNVFEISGGLENWFRKEYGKPGICVELVGSKYSANVNDLFEKKTEWDKTRGVILACLEE